MQVTFRVRLSSRDMFKISTHSHRRERPVVGSLQIVRFRTAEEKVATVEDEIHGVFDEVAATTPEGIQYLAARVGDQFLLLLHLTDPASNPLFGV